MNDLIMTPLGSVSPYCKDNKNCPGFLIEYGKYNILLDCGNGISRYLSFPNVLNNLYVFLSHLHLDHFGDLGTIEYASYVYNKIGLLNEKVKIYTPVSKSMYNNYNYCDYYMINDNSFIKLNDLIITFHNNNSHDIECYMIKIETSKYKIVYTSDIGNRYLDDVIDYCKECDLLICDSSLLIGQYNSNHLHAYEAGLIARDASVKRLMLTHFWPEIDKEKYLEEAKEYFENTIVAEENKKLILRR